MTLSIAMATFNGELFLREQLDSIIKQSLSDWELIVCDDCSTDNTWQILEEYAQRDSRIKIYLNDNNLGFLKNFENAILKCSGDYIALSDQDDIWTKNHLKTLLNNIVGNSAAVGNALIMDENGNSANYLLSEGDLYFNQGNNIDKLYTILCYRNPFFGSISLYKADELKDICFPIPDCVSCHDIWFSAVACCMKGLSYSFEPLAKHRIHGKNESGTHDVNFFYQVLSTINNNRKEFSKQRMGICDALLSRVPNLSDELKGHIQQIKSYHKNRLEGNRIKTILFMKKHYQQIFSRQDNNQFFSRCIGVLISG